MSATAPPDATQAARLMVPTSIILVIAIFFYVTRIWTRFHRSFNLDFIDGMISAALTLAIVNLVLTALSCQYGLGRHVNYVNTDLAVKARHYGFLVEPVCVWSICFSKCSTACTILRAGQSRVWRCVFSSIIAIQLASALVTTITLLVQCEPMSALWDGSIAILPSTHCWKPRQIHVSGYITQGSSILTNMVLALTPLAFLKTASRRLHEKIALGLLVSLGVLVALSTIINTVLFHRYFNMRDTLWDMVTPVLWWQIEQNCSIVASCVIGLRSPYKSVLIRLGLLRSNSRSSSTSGQLNILQEGSHSLDLYRTSIKADTTISIDPGNGPKTRGGLLYANRFSPSKAATPLSMITKTMEVVHSSEEVTDDIEWGSPARIASWR